MSDHTLTTVSFHGATLLARRGETPETTLVAMRPVVEGMGLNWKSQYTKIAGHPVLATCVVIITTQLPPDEQAREHVFLPLNRLNFWLATVHSNKVPDPATRARIINYQVECADALFAHFFGQTTQQSRSPSSPRPFDLLSPEQMNACANVVKMAHRLFGLAGGAWAWDQVMPASPPRHIRPSWGQHEMDLREGHSTGTLISITVPSGGTH